MMITLCLSIESGLRATNPRIPLLSASKLFNAAAVAVFTCKKESGKDAYYRRPTRILVGTSSRLTKQVVYQRGLLVCACAAFLFTTSQLRLQRLPQ